MPITLKSESTGVDIVINTAPWQDAMALKNAISKELAAAGIDIEIRANKEIDLKKIVSAVFALDASPEVNAALFACLARCTCGGMKITPALFDNQGYRKDYYQMVAACLEENYIPFLQGLPFGFNRILSLIPASVLKSK